VLVQHIDVVRAQPAQRSVNDFADVGGPTVEADCFTVGVDIEPELGGYQNAVAGRLQCFAHEFLVDVGPVPFCGVEEGDAAFCGGPDHGQCFRPVSGGTETEAEAHAAEADG
jgi:hypothetical protein